jgi:hypothetical protein
MSSTLICPLLLFWNLNWNQQDQTHHPTRQSKQTLPLLLLLVLSASLAL